MERKYTLNENAFQDLTPDIAWVLGLIASDGHVQTDRGFWTIGLHEQDKDVLDKVKVIIGSNSMLYHRPAENVTTKEGKKYYRGAQNTLYISSRVMVDDLMALGFTRHKSKELQWDDNRIPKHLLSHFVRGYFDGDGSISFATPSDWRHRVPVINFISTAHFTQGLQIAVNQAMDEQRGHIYSYDNPNTQRVTYGGPHSAMKILKWMYTDSTIENRMERKYEKYVEYIASGDWQAYLDREPLERITPEMAVGMRQLMTESHYDVRSLSELYKCSIEAVRAVLSHNSHTNFDGRDSRYTSYIEAFGVKKHIAEWIKDPRCVVGEETLYHRIYVQEMESQKALTLPADRANNPRTYFIEAFGESKSILQWSKEYDSPYTTLNYRINVLNMALEEAISTTRVVRERSADALPNHAVITKEDADKIRELKTAKLSNPVIADRLGISIHIVNDVIAGKTWKVDDYIAPSAERYAAKVVEYQGQQLTLTELSNLVGVPKSTIDRRLREGKTLEEAIIPGRHSIVRKPAEVGRSGLTPEIVRNIRLDYKNGLRGKVLQEKYGISKSADIDIIGNRTWKDDNGVWWKEVVCTAT